MAALIEAARETRNTSERLRAQSLGTRLTARRYEREMVVKLERAAQTCARTSLCVARVRRSPWSDLPCHAPDAELEHVVVLLPVSESL